MWNRVSLKTGRPVWPGHHWNKSKQAAREIEIELGLKRPTPRRAARTGKSTVGRKAAAQLHHSKRGARRQGFATRAHIPARPVTPLRTAFRVAGTELLAFMPISTRRAMRAAFCELAEPHRPMPIRRRHRHAALPTAVFGPALNADDSVRREVLAWAWANGRWDVLALYGIYVPLDL